MAEQTKATELHPPFDPHSHAPSIRVCACLETDPFDLTRLRAEALRLARSSRSSRTYAATVRDPSTCASAYCDKTSSTPRSRAQPLKLETEPMARRRNPRIYGVLESWTDRRAWPPDATPGTPNPRAPTAPALPRSPRPPDATEAPGAPCPPSSTPPVSSTPQPRSNWSHVARRTSTCRAAVNAVNRNASLVAAPHPVPSIRDNAAPTSDHFNAS